MAKFTIYPAIDIRGGKCVRLVQGDYARETIYGDSPLEMARQFEARGASWVHMVDLDGAKSKRRVNHQHILQVANELQVNIQVGGGIRTAEDVAYYLEQGISRVILGSVAVNNPDFTKEMLSLYGGNRIVIGLDARNGYVATEGWLDTTEVRAEDLGQELASHGAEMFIFTDISRDGTLSGPNTAAIRSLAQATGKQVIASGGVSKLDDVRELRSEWEQGVSGVIIGKALYTNQFTLAAALELEG